MWNDRGKVLNSLKFIPILCTKALVSNDSFKTPPVWRNKPYALRKSDVGPFLHMHCGPLLWTLIFSYFSIYFELESSEVTGWVILTAWFSLSETNWETNCWNLYPCFILIILVGGSRFLSRTSQYILLLSFLQLYGFFHDCLLKSDSTPCCIRLQTSLLVWSFLDDVQCHFSSKYGCVLWHPKRSSLVSFDRLYCPSITQACPKVVQQTLSKLQQAFSSIQSCVVSLHTDHVDLVSHLFSLKQLYLLIQGLSEAFHEVLDSWKTLLIILSGPLT